MDTSSAPGIAALATFRPERVLTNEELYARFSYEPGFLERKIGVERRYVCGPDEAVSDLAVGAARKLFESGAARPDEIDLLVVCTQNPDYKLPTTANLVQQRLGIPTTCAAFDINQGCSGYVYGLAVAGAMLGANGFRAALLITADAYSKVLDPTDRDTLPLFGDGAAATLLRPGGVGRLERASLGSDGAGALELVVRGGGSRHPAVEGRDDRLRMNGRAIFNFMMRQAPRSVEECLQLNGKTRDDVDVFIFHQASRYMLESLRTAMKLDPERAPIVLADGGNTVSSTLPMALETLGGLDALAGKRVLLCGFGVGLSWGSILVTIGHAKPDAAAPQKVLR
jgi:3-oxoacyl-[acyl-carrier-protein] synthase-3